MVKKSVTTVLEMATDPSLLHIAVAYDNDDFESHDYFTSNQWQMLIENTGATQETHCIERVGWQGLHEYYNYLAQKITSNWYFIWKYILVFYINNHFTIFVNSKNFSL